MKKTTKLQIIMYTLIFLGIVIALLALKLFEDNKTIITIAFIVMFVFLIIGAYLEHKVKKLKEEENKIETENKNKEILKHFALMQGEDDKIALIYQITTKQFDVLNKLIEEANLETSLDYSKEDNYYDLTITNRNFRKKGDFYMSSIYLDEHWRVALNSSSEEKILTNESNEEILEMFINDIKDFLEK